ncbi:MAG: fatty acid--CoA ligase family protein [Bacteroidota bacterium]|nr:fatty acid--CoA ligase family protein [Bacteroidota bacterium]
MESFYTDLSEEINIKWSDFLFDINNSSVLFTHIYTKDFYQIFKSIVLSILNKKPIVLLDFDFTFSELENLIGDLSLLESTYVNDNSINIKSIDELLESINNVNENWSLTLFTSGTTGLPKKVTHSFETLSRHVKQSENHLNNVWGYAYNPTHIAGIQVFLQALLNKNTIVRLFGLSKESIENSIFDFEVTNLSATPTFYRMLIPTLKIFPNVKRVSFGGEKLNNTIKDTISNIFPNAKITNIYASTEFGTLFASNGETFVVKEALKKLVKVVDNELFVSSQLLATTINDIGEWYATGDLVEVISCNPLEIKFLSRKNEMINVGGYKVNPNEVETCIYLLEKVKYVKVYPKKNSVLGNIICCDVVTDEIISENEIREFLRDKLQNFKIPRKINFVENIEFTRSGKLKRI